MNSRRFLLVVVFPFAWTYAMHSSAEQQTVLQPGLWETQLTGDLTELVDSTKKKMEEIFGELDEETRKSMEIELGSMEDHIKAPTQECVTPEEAADVTFGFLSEDDCDSSVNWSGPDSVELTENCSADTSNEKTVTTVRILNSKEFEGESSASHDGGDTIHFGFTSKWVADDCGDVEPE